MRFIKPLNIGSGKSDEELVREFTLTGDLDVLGVLYAEHMHLVYGVCLKYLKQREDSMDAVMQIFEKLITEIPRHDIQNFKSWLHVVTKNFCLMKLRSEKSMSEKLRDWTNESMIFMESTRVLHPIDEDPPDMEEALTDCIEKLKNEQKECIRFFYYENKCYTEISAIMDIDEKKVKSHLQNAKRNLKICLEEKNESKREE